ncbi:MAG: 16S rRNA (guanine(966)-N(2))-methyltransferase RsmD [bacterium]|nr:16S rRNA (guanine(966)-N(2))-methyltransferase RsmD [bacterium]
MRIISGSWRGHPLRVPKGTRATTDRVREAIFSILGSSDNLSVLDLYAGSGSLGLEALSRGASSACFVELSRQALTCIEGNLNHKEPRSVSLVKQDCLQYLHKAESTFDWIFCDPPYHDVDFDRLIAAFSQSKCMGSDSLLILETDRFHTLNCAAGLKAVDQRRFGDTMIHFIRRGESER